MYNMNRFIEAQLPVYEQVVRELKAGQKQSHWMWYIFPQIDGLGRSSTARYFALSSLEEAREYLDHPQLGARLRECVELVMQHHGRLDASQILGSLDAMKFRSSLTLFSLLEPGGIFTHALQLFSTENRISSLWIWPICCRKYLADGSACVLYEPFAHSFAGENAG